MKTARISPKDVAFFVIAASLLFRKLGICQISSGEGKPIIVNKNGDMRIIGELERFGRLVSKATREKLTRIHSKKQLGGVCDGQKPSHKGFMDAKACSSDGRRTD